MVGYFDGGARGNPGPAGSGYVLGLDANTDTGEVHTPIAAGVEYVGDYSTNNVAEMTALIGLLVAAIQNRDTFERLTIHGDSMLAFELIDGTKQCHSPKLKPLLARVIKLIEELAMGPRLVLKHVRREHNKMADRLSNVAMDYGITRTGLAVLDISLKTTAQRAVDRKRKQKDDAIKAAKVAKAAKIAEAEAEAEVEAETETEIEAKTKAETKVETGTETETEPANAASGPKAIRVRIQRRRDGTIVQDCDRYVGRACDLGGWDLKRDAFCNPITLQQCKNSNAEAVRRYRGYLASQPGLLRRIVGGELDGLRLGCFCDPPKPCHADVLCELANDHTKAEALLYDSPSQSL